MGQRKRDRHNASPDTSREKGDVLESIIQTMHGYPGAKVERNVYLPTVRDPDWRRENDVLISGNVGGYPIRIAIECKNVSSPIGVEEIGEFADKLEDVGIPVRQGVFVTSSRFRSGALRRARELGIQTLQYKNVKGDLPEAVSNAIQSLVYILLTIKKIQITNDIDSPGSAGEILFFWDDDGKLKGSVPDLVWRMWCDGELEMKLGSYSIDIELPSGWQEVVGGKIAKVARILIDYQVTGHVVDFPGDLDQHQLVDQLSGQITRYQVEATFDPPDGKYPVRIFSSENDVKTALMSRALLQIALGRVRLPRIRWMSLYWPPSQKAMSTLVSHLKSSLESGEEFDISAIGIEGIEGSDLKALWDTIISDHPMLDDCERA